MVLGALFALDQMGTVDVPPAGRWWPALLVVTGAARFVEAPQFRAVGAALALVGALLLLHTLDVLPLGRSWPALLLALGAGLVVAALRGRAGGARAPGA
jgi:hypothetical protein